MSLVVTGTGTEVGKTVVSAVLALRYGSARPLAYWKPIASGAVAGETDREAVARLTGGKVEVLAESYLFEAPVSPHLAARLEGRRLRPQKVVEELARHQARRPQVELVVEGVGGLLVPLTDDGELLVDLLGEMGLPCLVVAASTLGTINHTLLTLEALRRRQLEIAGVVMNGAPHEDNRSTVERLGGVEVLELAPIDPLDPGSLAAAAQDFDPEGRLAPYLDGGGRR